MPATVVDTKTQLVDAVLFVRDSRHHTACRCYSYRDTTGAGYCSDREAIWNRAVNRLLSECCGR